MVSRFEKVFLVKTLSDKVVKELAADTRKSDFFRFKMMPLVAVSANHRWASATPPGLEAIRSSKTSYGVAWAINRALLEANSIKRIWAPNGNRWVLDPTKRPPYLLMARDQPGTIVENAALIEDVRIAHPSAMTLSLELRPGNEIGDDHILGIATKCASKHMPVIVAAGNSGQFGNGSLNPIAKLPWTIAVGATEDDEGKKLHPSSSLGMPEDDEGHGVDFVAYGENQFNKGEFGTSFSAPVVTGQVLFITLFLLQVYAIEERRHSLRLGGVPLLQSYSIDTGYKDFDPAPRAPFAMMPDVGVDNEVISSLLKILDEEALKVDFSNFTPIVLRVLRKCAKPMDRYPRHAVGYGFLSDVLVYDFLKELTVSGFLDVAIGKKSRRISMPDELKETKISVEPGLNILYQLSKGSHLMHAIDYKDGKIRASMRDPSINRQERGFYKEESNYSWPNSL